MKLYDSIDLIIHFNGMGLFDLLSMKIIDIQHIFIVVKNIVSWKFRL